MAVDLAGDMGEMALDLAQFRAIQGAARDETRRKKSRKGNFDIFWGAQHEKGWYDFPRSFSPPSRSSDHREVFTWFKLSTKI
jgi:hypothetical protein